MKCIILAAGRGTRMGKLTENMPKPMLTYKDKNLLEHKLDALPDDVTDVVFVVGYKGEKIKEYFGNEWKGKKIHYAEQKEMLGTAHAVWMAKDVLDQPFIVLMGDDLYATSDMKKLADHYNQTGEWSILVEKSQPKEKAGKAIMDENGNLKEIIEDRVGEIDGPIYTGVCLLGPEIFDYEMAKLPDVNEYGLPQTFCQALPDRPIKIHYVDFWKRITAPEDLE